MLFLERQQMKHILIRGVLTAFLIAYSPTFTASPAAATGITTNAGVESARLNTLADSYWNAQARFNPLMASDLGDSRFLDQIGMAIGPRQRAAQFVLYRDMVTQLHTIQRDRLSPRDQTTWDILDYDLAANLRLAAFPEHLLPLDQIESLPIEIANVSTGEGTQPLHSVKDYRAYLNRLDQLGPWIDQAIVNMREGIKQGIVLPKAVMVSALPQFKQLVAVNAEHSIYYTPVNNFPRGFSQSQTDRCLPVHDR
jgi:uncharacterized protein (DUF885 family)